LYKEYWIAGILSTPKHPQYGNGAVEKAPRKAGCAERYSLQKYL
jgi:hypothetical protein